MSHHVSDIVTTVEQAISRLQQEALSLNTGTILSISVEHPPRENILQHQTEYPLLYWKSRDEDTQYYCWGISRKGSSLHETPRNGLIPSFAVYAFDAQTTQWPGFPADLIWTPRWCLQKNQSGLILYHLVSPKNEMILSKGKPPNAQKHLPNEESWIQQIEHLKTSFTQESLSKIVLSRQSCIQTGNIWHLFEQLTSEQPDCYHFLFAPQQDHVFLGCSPERLFSISNAQLQTEAMAGTRPRGFAPKEDLKLNQELCNSHKDIAEHNFVTNYITKKLQPYTKNINIHQRRILRLKNVQHLHTPITATLNDDFSVEQILSALHPTPAVCGYPKELSYAKIRQIEPFSRGWYTGTLGILRSDRIDFTVAIRSALSIGEKLFIWAGAGIVAESNASAEWLEITTKAQQFFDLAQQ